MGPATSAILIDERVEKLERLEAKGLKQQQRELLECLIKPDTQHKGALYWPVPKN
jgi:hypothetical protein